MIVEEILRTKGSKVHTIAADRAIVDAINLLNEANIGALVVIDANGRLTGILSERDIVRRLSNDPARLFSMKVGECMTPKPHTCGPLTDIEELMVVMTEKRIRHVPVEQDGELLGLVSIGDVVKRKIEMAEFEAATLREYISS